MRDSIVAPAPLVLVCVLACGGGRSALDLPSPVAHTSASSVDFGLADCGGSGDTRTVNLTNDATALPLSWTATIDGPYALQGPVSGQLFSHESATVTILPEIPGTAEAAFPVPGTLRFLTNDPAHPTIEIPLTAIARGATLAFPSSVDFGDVPLSATSPDVPVAVKNTGNLGADFEVAVAPGSDFAPGGANLHVGPGASGSALFHFTPTTWGQKNGSLTVTVKGPVCGVGSSVIPLTGRGTKGVVLTSPGSLDFGLVDCGMQAGAQVVHIENHGDASFGFNTAFTTSKSYAVSPSQGTLAPSATVDLIITPVSVPSTSAVTPDLYGDTLTITTDAVGDAPHVVALHETARGAILVTDGSTTALGNRIVDDLISAPWGTIQNVGNVTIAVTGSSPVGASLSAPVVVPQGGSAIAGLTLQIDPAHAALGTTTNTSVTLAGNAATCAPLLALPFTVRAVDRALDVGMAEGLCVVGHTHRGYCKGAEVRAEWLGVSSPVAQSYDFILQPALVADRVAILYGRACWASGSQLNCVGPGIDAANPYIPVVTTLSLPGPIAELNSLYPFGYPADRLFIRLASGALYAWRDDVYGTFGNGSVATSGLGPAMGGLQNATSAAFGRSWGCAATSDGTVLCAGAIGAYLVPSPTVVPGVQARRIDAGDTGSCAAALDGTVVCWRGQTFETVVVAGITDAVDVRLWGGFGSGCAIRAGGGVRCWQYNGLSDIGGLGGSVNKIVNGEVPEPNSQTASFCALESGGTVSCWGLGPAHAVPGFD